MDNTERIRRLATRAVQACNADWDGAREHDGNYWTGYLLSTLGDIIATLDEQ